MRKLILFLKTNLIKTLYFNIKLFGLRSIFKPKIFIGYNCYIKIKKKDLFFEKDSKILIGIDIPKNKSNCNNKTVFNINGSLSINGCCNICKSANVYVDSFGKLIINDIYLGPQSSIICYYYIEIRKNTIISWDCTIIDSDTHDIFDEENNIINDNKKIFIGNCCWIGFGSTILKGVTIPNNNIIACKSLISKTFNMEEKMIINSNRILKKYKYFKI